MFDLVRNLVAFLATFTAIMTITMIVTHLGISVCTKASRLTYRQEVVSFWIGMMFALLLIPFYSLPC